MQIPTLSGDLNIPGLDLVVKYSVLLTWLTYFAGVFNISEYLHTLGAPRDLKIFRISTVLSYGLATILKIAIPATLVLILMLCLERFRGSLWGVFALLIPVPLILAWFMLWQDRAVRRDKHLPFFLKSKYWFCFLGASYLTVLVIRYWGRAVETPRSMQLLIALVMFVLVTKGAGYTGQLDGYRRRNDAPTARLLLARELIGSAGELGITFSTPGEPGLSDGLNVVVITEEIYYVWIKKRDGVVAIPREKVLLEQKSLSEKAT